MLLGANPLDLLGYHKIDFQSELVLPCGGKKGRK
jgi:hypothetical protein